jgi:integrase
MPVGIDTRHARSCRIRGGGGRCNCTPTYRARVFDKRSGQRLVKTFPTHAAAKTWRQDAIIALRTGGLAPTRTPTLSDALDDLIDGMSSGRILDRAGKPYKPATVRSYRRAADGYLKPRLGHWRLSELRRRDVQDVLDALRTEGLAASTIHNKIDPLRVLYRRGLQRDEVSADPTHGLELPANRARRDRIESPERAGALLAALPDSERPLWATLLYAGLRIGEARALRWRHVEFDAGVIRVERGWDDVEGEIEVKTGAGRRTVPLAGHVRRELAALKLRTGRDGDDLVFGRTPTLPFVRSTIRSRANRAWQAAGMEPLTPHEARHCAASYLIAAGLNAKQLSVYIGHSDIRTTYNRYGHLMPGDERQAARQLDTYLCGAAVAVTGTAT